MIKTKYLVIAAAALFVVVVGTGALILSIPYIFERQVEPGPGGTSTQPVVFIPTSTPILIVQETAVPTETDEPTDIPTDVPTETDEPTEMPTNVPTNTPVPLPCEWASFVKDVSIEDGERMSPDEEFVKTWRLKNIGSCTWTTSYDLVFVNGNDFDAARSVALPGQVRPGETIDLSLQMRAPEADGEYTGYWMLRNPSGEVFGINEDRSHAFWVTIEVELPCYWAKFVSDVTVPDGTNFAPDTVFVKTWKLRNIGDCRWTDTFDVVHVSGDKMGATVVDMPERVRPGETVEVSVTLTAPDDPDGYRGYWMIEADNGTIFGIGDDQDDPFWVDIDVLDTDTSYGYDFAANYCKAKWKSSAAALDCPGSSSDDEGFVIKLNNPNLENRHENEPALWMRPEDDDNGWIEGKFPAILINDGDHFRAWVGCLADADDCNITFYLDYQIGDGSVVNLGSWDEINEGLVTEIDIDLSGLDDEYVKFILSVEVNGGDPDEADGFWFAPRIE